MGSCHRTPIRNVQSPPKLQNLENEDIYKDQCSLHLNCQPIMLEFDTHTQNVLLIKVHMKSGHQTSIGNLQCTPNLQNLENDDVYKDQCSLHHNFQPIMQKFGTHTQNLLLIKVHIGFCQQTPIRNDDVYKDQCSLKLQSGTARVFQTSISSGDWWHLQRLVYFVPLFLTQNGGVSLKCFVTHKRSRMTFFNLWPNDASKQKMLENRPPLKFFCTICKYDINFKCRDWWITSPSVQKRGQPQSVRKCSNCGKAGKNIFHHCISVNNTDIYRPCSDSLSWQYANKTGSSCYGCVTETLWVKLKILSYCCFCRLTVNKC